MKILKYWIICAKTCALTSSGRIMLVATDDAIGLCRLIRSIAAIKAWAAPASSISFTTPKDRCELDSCWPVKLALLLLGDERPKQRSPQAEIAHISVAAWSSEVSFSWDEFSTECWPQLERANTKSAITRLRPSPERATRQTIKRAPAWESFVLVYAFSFSCSSESLTELSRGWGRILCKMKETAVWGGSRHPAIAWWNLLEPCGLYRWIAAPHAGTAKTRSDKVFK